MSNRWRRHAFPTTLVYLFPLRHFDKISPRLRSQLLDALASNVPFLVSSISKLGPMERAHPSLHQHRNALQM